jgi:hypothetical protein
MPSTRLPAATTSSYLCRGKLGFDSLPRHQLTVLICPDISYSFVKAVALSTARHRHASHAGDVLPGVLRSAGTTQQAQGRWQRTWRVKIIPRMASVQLSDPHGRLQPRSTHWYSYRLRSRGYAMNILEEPRLPTVARSRRKVLLALAGDPLCGAAVRQ